MSGTKVRVTVWNEFVHERELPEIAAVYPDGIHGAIREFLETNEDIEVKTATLDEPNQGLSRDLLANTDVLIASTTIMASSKVIVLDNVFFMSFYLLCLYNNQTEPFIASF